ncbi:olfactory receptor 52E2-like [Carettochelys insculpta]|uniref:olfactory receptor 52E2-like n=1 Tax=Carettochelys insculpta TaxID=44489 RepID=UPI003EB830B3
MDHLMTALNVTPFEPASFLLLGIPGLEAAHLWASIPFSLCLIISLLGNVVILFLVGKEQTLHKPMYLLLCILALTDIATSTLVVPKALCIFWFNLKGFSFGACLTQMFFLHTLSATQSGILVAMAFDRYIAICNPLRYTTLLSNARIAQLGLVSLLRALVYTVPMPLLLRGLPFCTNHIIPHTYCEYMAVAKLSCGDITVIRLHGLVITIFNVGLDVSLIVLSYTHICVLLLFWIPSIFTVMTHRFGQGIAPHVHIILANFHLLLPPMLNPIIYGIKTKELRDKVVKYTDKE